MSGYIVTVFDEPRGDSTTTWVFDHVTLLHGWVVGEVAEREGVAEADIWMAIPAHQVIRVDREG